MNGFPEASILAGLALGWLMQQARAFKGVNNWLVWAGVAVASGLLWIFATPDAFSAFATNWRGAVVSIVSFAASAGGYGKALKDMKAAPPADTK